MCYQNKLKPSPYPAFHKKSFPHAQHNSSKTFNQLSSLPATPLTHTTPLPTKEKGKYKRRGRTKKRAEILPQQLSDKGNYLPLVEVYQF